MGSDQIHDNFINPSGSFTKASILHEMGRFMERAYEQGVTLEEAYAICGAAYGDWYEEHEEKTRAMSGEEGERLRR